MMNSGPFFSIIIPTYNRNEQLLPTLKTVQQQSFTDLECIIVDDGSKNPHILQRIISSLNDPRFKYVRRDNGGGGAARNTGIINSKGLYICFLDSDDFFLPLKLEQYKKEIEKQALYLNNKTVLYSYMYVERGVAKRWTRPDRPIGLTEDVTEYMFSSNQFIQTSTICLFSNFAKECMFDPSLRKGQDLDFCVRLQANGATFRMIEKPLTIWNDITEVGRTSRHEGYNAPKIWLEKNKKLLSKKAYHGYRATVLAYYCSKAKPFSSFSYILLGLIIGGVPLKITARQFLRCYLSKQTYRKLVNYFVRRKGI
jgi:glycosyltransferase involved in cell wall biosynthesis